MKLSIAQRLKVMVFGAIVTLLIVGCAGVYSARAIRSALEYSQEQTIPSMKVFAQIEKLVGDINTAGIYRGMTSRPETIVEKDNIIDNSEKKLQQLFRDYDKNLATGAEDRRLLQADQAALTAYIRALRDALSRTKTYSKDFAMNMLQSEVEPLSNQLQQALEKHAEYHTARARSLEQQSSNGATVALVLTIVLTLIGSIVVGVVGFLLTNTITRSLFEMQHAIGKIESDLDFTYRITEISNDDLGETCSALNRLISKMQENLKVLSSGASKVAESAQMMASASMNVDSVAKRQNSAANSMSTTVEEITVSLSHVSEQTSEANRLSKLSGDLASAGERVIEQTVSGIQDVATTVNSAAATIRELEIEAGKISGVVTVIKEVADQTNLLALNAAIEAARAGEQGRGFAVVADEVRKLAERTASSTQEIASTISSMLSRANVAVTDMHEVVNKVAEGVNRANKASESIQQIGSGSRQSVAMVEQITGAIKAQDSATSSIATHVECIAQMADESSAAAHESANAAQELARLASQMQGIVAAYRL